ncbi:hypothetical protein ACIBG7_03885 [Nonomuraea sp. NPDC050328]|uniref:hypothetical protein n=1 Tax=Nonomuraea sp. NPDC050328 TaxID=3364361 RepID=UPI0037BBE719
MIRRLVLALLLAAAAAWSLLPLADAGRDPAPGRRTSQVAELDRQAGPIRYGYRPGCLDGFIDRDCLTWRLADTAARHWALPGGGDSLRLSGRFALVGLWEQGVVVVHDLTSGKKSEHPSGKVAVSPDGTTLAHLYGRVLTLRPVAGGRSRRVKVGADPVFHGWTSRGVLLTVARRSAEPGRLHWAELIEYSPDGKRMGATPIPSGLAGPLRISPDGRRAAAPGVVLDPATGKVLHTFQADEVAGWLDHSRLVVLRSTRYWVLDPATGTSTPFGPDEAAPGTLVLNDYQ